MSDYKYLLPQIIDLAREASDAILAIYQQKNSFDIHIKADKTPVTAADMAAHRIIKTGLENLTPDIPILSEEAANISYDTRKTWSRYWLIDPLDGTKEFIAGTDDFTVNIALIDHHKSVLGVIYLPILQWCYYACQNHKAYKIINQSSSLPIHTRKAKNPLTIALSRRHGKAELSQFIEIIQNHNIIHRGSSLKSGLVAEGAADLYTSFGKTSEWDTGAAQCIVEEAGGAILDLKLQPLRYNDKSSLINPAFLVIGDSSYNWEQFLNLNH